jgi:hypothetical protein
MRVIARLLCLLFGHKRGQRVTSSDPESVEYMCPRCSATWTRKIRKAKA